MNRFSDIDCSFKKLPPVDGINSVKHVSLETALEPITFQINGLVYYIKEAKKYCYYPNEHGLSKDQSASIYIYTMEWGETSLYRVLNRALRSENRQTLKIWLPYLKLFDSALDLLPTVQGIVWRGVSLDIGRDLIKDQVFTWWAISSCSSSVDVIGNFLQNKNNSTLFLIEIVNGIKVSWYTAYKNEDEVILKIGAKFRTKANPLKRADGSYTVHIVEIDDKQLLAAPIKNLYVDSNSTAEVLDSSRMYKVGKQYGGAGGVKFTDSKYVYDLSFPIKIEVAYGTGIDYIEITYSSNTNYQSDELKVIRHGTLTSNLKTGSFHTSNSDKINKIFLTYGNVDITHPHVIIVTGIQFHTINGKSSQFFGTKTGSISIEEHPGYYLHYISGRSGSHLDQLQFHWHKI